MSTTTCLRLSSPADTGPPRRNKLLEVYHRFLRPQGCNAAGGTVAKVTLTAKASSRKGEPNLYLTIAGTLALRRHPILRAPADRAGALLNGHNICTRQSCGKRDSLSAMGSNRRIAGTGPPSKTSRCGAPATGQPVAAPKNLPGGTCRPNGSIRPSPARAWDSSNWLRNKEIELPAEWESALRRKSIPRATPPVCRPRSRARSRCA